MNKNEMFEQINIEIDKVIVPTNEDADLLKKNVKKIINVFLTDLIEGLAEAMRTEPPT